MKIVIVGAGEVGYCLSHALSEKGHEVTVVESSEAGASQTDEELNVKVIGGNGSSAQILSQARVGEADYFLAMTRDDRTNLIACSLARALGSKNTIARMHDSTYRDNSYVNYQVHFGVDYLLNPEALCAVEIAKQIRNPGRVAVQEFARGKIEVQGVTVSPKSKFLGKSLREIKLDRNVRIGFIQRQEESLIAKADTTLEVNDIITLFGPPDLLFQAKQDIEGSKTKNLVRIVLYGGGEVSIALVRLLTNPRFKIRIIEKDIKLCQLLAEEFPHITVIHGDATSRRLLEEEQVGSADYFIGSSKDDEDNFMSCLLAKQLGTQGIKLVINKPDYEGVLNSVKDSLGLGLVVSPRQATVKEILRYISNEPFVELSSLPHGNGKIFEVRVDVNSSCVGKKIKDLPIQGAPIVALLHKFNAKVPGAEDSILAGDRLVIILQEDNAKSILKSLL